MNALQSARFMVYTGPVTSKKGVIGLGGPCTRRHKAAAVRVSGFFHVSAPFMVAPIGEPQGSQVKGLRRVPVRQSCRGLPPSWRLVAVQYVDTRLEAIMANDLTPFNFGQSTIRTLTIGNAVWFVAADVAKALGYKNTSKAVADHLDDDEKGVTTGYTLGGEQKLTVINESGLYALVLRSRKPEARKFTKWVTGEVLPTIRRTGSYQTTPDHFAHKTGNHGETITVIVNRWAMQLAEPNSYPPEIFLPLVRVAMAKLGLVALARVHLDSAFSANQRIGSRHL